MTSATDGPLIPDSHDSGSKRGASGSETRRAQLLSRFWEQTISGHINSIQSVRTRLLLLLSALSIVVNLIYAGAAASTQQVQALSIYGMTLVILAGVFVSARKVGWRRPTAIVYIGSAVLSLTLFLLLDAEVPSAVAAWLPFIPMLAMILLDRRDGVIATLVATTWFCGVVIALQWHTSADPLLIVLQRSLPTLLAFAGTALAAVAVLLVYVYIRDVAFGQQQRERQAKEALLRILCHDISGDLSIIRMSAMMANSPQRSDRIPEALKRIRTSTESIIEMVQTVRSMAALEAGKLAVRLQPVSLIEVIQHALARWEGPAAHKGVILIADLPDAALQVWADSTYLEQTVLGNIINNAIKFTPAGGRVRLVAQKGSEPGSVLITVTDEGIGIPTELMEHLFDPGKYTSREGTDGEAGTGFGLPLVKQFVQHFGGDIHAHSQGEGAGATFEITLRRASAGDQSPPATQSSP